MLSYRFSYMFIGISGPPLLPGADGARCLRRHHLLVTHERNDDHARLAGFIRIAISRDCHQRLDVGHTYVAQYELPSCQLT